MTIIAKALVELAGCLEIAKFDDPDEAQGAEDLLEWCLIEASPQEREILAKVARERAQEEAAKSSDRQIIEFYERFAARAEDHQKYG
ncbi:MAG: hypothetical protein J0M24_21890 [Verrucomicrobia bacterium]|nr:hypothetical protein [Verrucomicrobiota bacterium]